MTRSDVSLFLSHADSDKAIVRAVGDSLSSLGYQVWLDEEMLVIGDDVQSKIRQGVSDADFLLLFVSEAAMHSYWVDEEWRAKFDQQVSDQRVRVLTIQLEPVAIPSPLNDTLSLKAWPVEQFLQDGYLQIDRAVRQHIARSEGKSNSQRDAQLRTLPNVRQEITDASMDGVKSWMSAIAGRWSGRRSA